MYDLASNLPYIVPKNHIIHPSLSHPVKIPTPLILRDSLPFHTVVHHYLEVLIRDKFLEVAILAGLDNPQDRNLSLSQMLIYFNLKLHLQEGKARITDGLK